ncbi:MAG TPA: plastocyanin/azurin family copper-binding protein [Ktedonobacteraceae bacterium]|nr:plastocyanin/azurin family copper-binding protein [Ktedonobacteraceae bacterium]
MKKFVVSLILLGFMLLFLPACAGGTGSCSGSSKGSSGGTPTMYMCGNSFAQSSITINKGQSLKLVNNASDVHVIANGTWNNGTAQPGRESGAPEVNNVNIGGNGSATIGPFTTAGTFKLYCTVHPGMNLTVIVK